MFCGHFDLSLVLLQPGPKYLLNKHYLIPKSFFRLLYLEKRLPELLKLAHPFWPFITLLNSFSALIQWFITKLDHYFKFPTKKICLKFSTLKSLSCLFTMLNLMWRFFLLVAIKDLMFSLIQFVQSTLNKINTR